MPPAAKPTVSHLPDEGVWRVARTSDPLKPSNILPWEADLPNAGNRFDIPGVGVLYFATSLRGCFAETLSRYRPTTSSLIAKLARQDAEDQGLMAPGAVPAEWRESRVAVRVSCAGAFDFIDVDDPTTHTFLTARLAAELAQLEVEALDVPTVRGPDRRITRLCSRWAYQPDNELPVGYAGIRYVSRLGDWECWAVFDDVALQEVERRLIELSDPELVDIATQFGLQVF